MGINRIQKYRKFITWLICVSLGIIVGLLIFRAYHRQEFKFGLSDTVYLKPSLIKIEQAEHASKTLSLGHIGFDVENLNLLAFDYDIDPNGFNYFTLYFLFDDFFAIVRNPAHVNEFVKIKFMGETFSDYKDVQINDCYSFNFSDGNYYPWNIGLMYHYEILKEAAFNIPGNFFIENIFLSKDKFFEKMWLLHCKNLSFLLAERIAIIEGMHFNGTISAHISKADIIRGQLDNRMYIETKNNAYWRIFMKLWSKENKYLTSIELFVPRYKSWEELECFLHLFFSSIFVGDFIDKEDCLNHLGIQSQVIYNKIPNLKVLDTALIENIFNMSNTK